MEITYLNHSSFLIKTKFEGNKLIKIVIDPYDPSTGISFKSTEADIVLLTHLHDDHSYVQGIKGLEKQDLNDESFGSNADKPYIIKASGEYEVKGVRIWGISSYHDAKEGKERGENTIYVIENEGYRICHLGDLGQKLNEQQIEKIGNIDVLLIPVGGTYTVDPDIASEVISQVEPGFVIPMHYKTQNHTAESFKDILPLKAFLDTMGKESIKPQDSFEVKIGTAEETEVIVLNPKY